MKNSNFLNLIKKLGENSENFEKIKACKTKEELYSFCHNLVGGYSQKEFDAFVIGLSLISKKPKLLSNNSLNAVSGGKSSVREISEKLTNIAEPLTLLPQYFEIFQKMYFEDIDEMDMDEIMQLMISTLNKTLE